MQATSLKIKKRSIAMLFPASIAIAILGIMPIPGIPISAYQFLQLIILLLMGSFLIITDSTFSINFMNPIMIFLTGFFFFALVSTLFSENTGLAFSEVFRIMRLFLMTAVIFFFLKEFWEPEYVSALIKVLGWIGVLGAITIILDYLEWVPFTKFYIMLGVKEESRMWLTRQIGAFGTPNFAAGQLGIFLPFILFMFFSAQKKPNIKASTVYAISTGIVVLGMLMSGSRMGFIIIGTTLAIVLMKELRHLLNIRFILVILLICGTLFFIKPTLDPLIESASFRTKSLLTFLSKGKEIRGRSMRDRVELLKAGLKMFLDKPLLGFGLGNYRYKLYQYSYFSRKKLAHNTWIEFLVGIGGIGFLFLMVSLLYVEYIFFQFWRKIKNSEFFYLQLAFLNLVIMLFFLSDISSPYLWGAFLPLSMYLSCQKRR